MSWSIEIKVSTALLQGLWNCVLNCKLISAMVMLFRYNACVMAWCHARVTQLTVDSYRDRFLEMLGPEDLTKRRELHLQRCTITQQKMSVFVITAGMTPNVDSFNESWHIWVWWYSMNYFLLRIRILLVKINCCTNRKLAGSIPGDVTGILHWHKPSGRTVARVDSASNRNVYQEYLLGG